MILFSTPDYWAIAGIGLITSLVLCLLIVSTQCWHGHLTQDHTEGVQKFHTAPTPRIGGVGIACGLVALNYALPSEEKYLLQPMLLAALPAFGMGLLEDITRRVGIRDRLLATLFSGLLAWLLTGISLTRLDIWGLDALMLYPVFAVAFTAFAIGGVANAVNIIDGFNGLASGSVVICLAAMGLIAYQVGDTPLANLCFVLLAPVFGFMCLNFPWGKIFLGDGGAYGLGFVLAWIAVLLLYRNPSVSVWAPLLACAYPVLEVLFSIARRRYRQVSPGHPDRLHLHSLVKFRIVRKKFKALSAVMRNAAVSLVMWFYAVLPATLAVLGYKSVLFLIFAWIGCAYVYSLCYGRLVYYRWRLIRFGK